MDLLVEYCVVKLDQLMAVVAAMDDETANTVPSFPGANSPYQILSHCLGMATDWSRTVNRGIPTPRDRDAEFAASGPVEELLRRAEHTREQFLADADATDLNAPPLAPKPIPRNWWQTTARQVLLHVFEELSQHLGQLEITRDVIGAGRSAG